MLVHYLIRPGPGGCRRCPCTGPRILRGPLPWDTWIGLIHTWYWTSFVLQFPSLSIVIPCVIPVCPTPSRSADPATGSRSPDRLALPLITTRRERKDTALACRLRSPSFRLQSFTYASNPARLSRAADCCCCAASSRWLVRLGKPRNGEPKKLNRHQFPWSRVRLFFVVLKSPNPACPYIYFPLIYALRLVWQIHALRRNWWMRSVLIASSTTLHKEILEEIFKVICINSLIQMQLWFIVSFCWWNLIYTYINYYYYYILLRALTEPRVLFSHRATEISRPGLYLIILATNKRNKVLCAVIITHGCARTSLRC